jgi:hypothetical protein
MNNKKLFNKNLMQIQERAQFLNSDRTIINYSFNFLFLGVETNLSFVLITLSFFMVYYTYRKTTSIIAICLAVIIFFTIVSFLFPSFSFFFMLFISGIILIISFPYNIYERFLERRLVVVKDLLNLLERLEILDFLATIYIMFFCVSSRIFKFRLAFIVIGSLVYLLTSRYYFIHKVFLNTTFMPSTYVFIYLAFFLGIMLSYFRFLVNLSLIFIPLTLKIQPTLLSPTVLYILDGDEDTSNNDFSKQSNQDLTKKRFSLINVDRSRNYYRNTFSGQNPSGFRIAGFCLGICTLVIGSVAAYYAKAQADYAKAQADYAKIQAEESKKQSYHTAREADVAAVEAKLITEAEYYRRHPEDKPQSKS